MNCIITEYKRNANLSDYFDLDSYLSEYINSLTRNTDEVIAGCYTDISEVGNLGAGNVSRYYMNNLHSERIRQNGDIIKIKFWFGLLTNVTGIIFQVWRYDGAAEPLPLCENTGSCPGNPASR